VAVSVCVAATAAITASRSPSVTFANYVPLQNDLIVFWASSTGTALTMTEPSGWVNPLGAGVDVESDSHQLVCAYHFVTSGEASAVTLTYTATNWYGATTTGNVIAVVLRGVDTTTPIDSANSTFSSTNTVTPSVLASLTGANLSTGSLVLSGVCLDGTGTFTTPAGWNQIATSNTNQGKWVGYNTTLTTAGSNVSATNITPSVGDEYASITMAFTPAASIAANPTVDSVGTVLVGTASTANVASPLGVRPNDVVLVMGWVEAASISAPDGTWTDLDSTPAAVGSVKTVAFWKRASAQDTGTYNFTPSGSAYRKMVAVRVAGCITSGSPVDTFDNEVQSTPSTAVPNTSLNTSVDNALKLWYAHMVSNATVTGPTGYLQHLFDNQSGNDNAMFIKSLPQAAQGSSGTVSATWSVSDVSFAWLIALKPPASGSNLTGGGDDALGLTDSVALTVGKTATDTVGLTDSTALQVGKTATDTVGLTDSATAALGFDRSATDTVGLTDSTVVEVGRNPTDTVGLTDSVDVVKDVDRSATDTMGLTDSVTAGLLFDRAATDTVGLTDAVAVVQGFDRSNTDTIGLTDSATVELALDRSATDTVGLTDSATAALGFDKSATDTLGLTDSATAVLGLDREATDALGLTDSADTALGFDRSATDELGLTDSVTVVNELDREATDELALTDSVETVADVERAATDTMGLTDSVTADLSTAGENVSTDLLGLTDSATTAMAAERDATDELGLTDDVTAELFTAADATDTLGLTDDVSVLSDYDRQFLDTVGITDTVSVESGRETTDTIGMTDSVTAELFAGATVTDELGITDSVDTTLDAHRDVTDTIGMTDSVTAVMGSPNEYTDTLGMRDSVYLVFNGKLVFNPERLLVVPAEDRTLRVPAEDRTLVVAAENRTLRVAAEDRTLRVAAEDRTLVVPAESRTLQIE